MATTVNILIFIALVLGVLYLCYMIPKLIVTAYYDAKINYTMKMAKVITSMEQVFKNLIGDKSPEDNNKNDPTRNNHPWK